MPSVPLLLAVTFISVFSTGTLGVSHGFVDRIACSCFTVIASNLWYVVLTGMQCLKFQLQCLCKGSAGRSKQQEQSKKRGAVVDDRGRGDTGDDVVVITGQYSLKTILCHTIEFRHAPREVRLFVSRKELWYTLYPTAFAVFVLFYCLPIYDVSCTVSLVVGLLCKSTYDELKRGAYWKRSTGRTMCFVFATLSGVLCATGLLVLSAVISRHSWGQSSVNATAVATTAAQTRPDNMIGTLLHGDGMENDFRRAGRLFRGNESSNFTEVVDRTVVEADNIGQDVRDALTTAYTASKQNPNLGQMIVVWAACSYIPFFLGHTPDSIRLPVLLEIIQPSISCMAAVVLFLACATSPHGWYAGHLLRNPSVVAYMCVVPLGVWCAVFFLIRASRAKTTAHVCCILMVAAYVKLLHVMSTFPARGHGLRSVSVFVGCVCGVYTFLTVVFIRMENKCIQMGWDTGQDDDDDLDEDYDMDFSASNRPAHDGSQHYDDDGPIHARYCIEDVLQRVTNDIKTTEYILSNPSSKATLSQLVPSVVRTDTSSTQDTVGAGVSGGNGGNEAGGMAHSVDVGGAKKVGATVQVVAKDPQPARLDTHEEVDMEEDDDVKHALLPMSPETQTEKRAVRSVGQHTLPTPAAEKPGP